MACACSIWHTYTVGGARECVCHCHVELSPDETADLALLAARIQAGGYADDRQPLSAVIGWSGDQRTYALIPWRTAIEIE